MSSSQGEGGPVGGASAVVMDVRRVQKPTQRIRHLQEQLQAEVSSNSVFFLPPSRPSTPPLTGPEACVVLQAESKKKRSASSSFSCSPLKKRPCKSAGIQNPLSDPGPGRVFGPSVPRRVMLVMSPTGSVQLSAPKSLLASPLLGGAYPPNQPMAFRPLPSGVATPPRSSIRPARALLPYKIKSDATMPPPLRREALQFDPALIFLEPQEAVRDWLSGRGGVQLPGGGVSLPYLPPLVSSLSALSALLCLQRSLTRLSLQLLAGPHPPTTANQHAELSDCTPDSTPGR